jgi:hypothetical protein
LGFERLDTVAGFGHHAQVLFLVENVGHASPQHGVIVDEKDPRRIGHGRGGFSWRHGPASAGLRDLPPRFGFGQRVLRHDGYNRVARTRGV